MSSAFADLCSAIGIWLGGRKAVVHPAAAVSPTGAGYPTSWPDHGHGRDDPHVPFAFQDPEIVALVRRAVDEAMKSDRPEAPRLDQIPILPKSEPIPATDAEIASALEQLFSGPTLATLEAERREAARQATLETMKLADAWAVEDGRRARRLSFEAAALRDEDDALIALLLS